MCSRVCWSFLAFSFSLCSLASRKAMGDTSVYILCNMLEPWSSLETCRQCCKKTNCSCQCSLWLWVFLLFFPPSHTAFESRFCYANGFLPAAAELSTVGARKEPADTARKLGALFPAAHQPSNTALPQWLRLALSLLYVLLPGEVAAEPFSEVWGCVTIPCWLRKKQCVRTKDSVPVWNGINVQMEGCLLP